VGGDEVDDVVAVDGDGVGHGSRETARRSQGKLSR
jgi:hypothetical protein